MMIVYIYKSTNILFFSIYSYRRHPFTMEKCSLNSINKLAIMISTVVLAFVLIATIIYFAYVRYNNVEEMFNTPGQTSVNYAEPISAFTQQQSTQGESSCTFPKIKYPPEAEFRTCQVYLTNQTKEACDAAKAADPLNTCKYEFNGWQEFKTTKDANNNIIDYPFKVYSTSQTKSITNAPLVNKCFKEFKDNSFARSFEYQNNALVNHDCTGATSDTDHDTNRFNGMKYTSFNFLNSNDVSNNYNSMLDSICSVKYNTIPDLKRKTFFKLVLNPDKSIKTIDKLTIKEDQTGFVKDESFTEKQFTASSAYGLAYDNTSRSGKNFVVFSVTSFAPKVVNIYKFTYNYLCQDKQIMSFDKVSTTLIIDRLLDIQTTKQEYTYIDLKNVALDWSKYKVSSVDQKSIIMADLESALTRIKTNINNETKAAIEEQASIIREQQSLAEAGRKTYIEYNPSFDEITNIRNFDIKKGAIVNKKELSFTNMDFYPETVIKKGKFKKGLTLYKFSGYFWDNVADLNQKIDSKQYTFTTSGIMNMYRLNEATTSKTGGPSLSQAPDIQENYSMVWKGYFRALWSGNYRFLTYSDDASYVFINNKILNTTNNGGQHGVKGEVSNNLYLEEGSMNMIMIYFGENRGGDDMYFFWQHQNTGWQKLAEYQGQCLWWDVCNECSCDANTLCLDVDIKPTKINDTQYCYVLTDPNMVHEITVPNETVCDVLIVGGGGGGGMDMGGGGGGGGVIYKSGHKINGTVKAQIGLGGQGAPAAGTQGQPSRHQYKISATNGGDSKFGDLIAKGGGKGGSSVWRFTPDNGYGANGGSGGGASGYNESGTTGRGGTGTTGQGFAGGGGVGNYYSGGGGGAGQAGGSGRGSGAAKGGDGIANDILGTSYYWGGGGGGSGYSTNGGNGGAGGGGGGAIGTTTGGAGYNNNNGGAGGGGGTHQWANKPGGHAGENTGGGGGGGSHYNANNNGGNGGSGIVIIRFSKTMHIMNTIFDNLSFYTNTTNLISWYKMDSDNMLLDSSGKNNNLIDVGQHIFDSNAYVKGNGSVRLNGSGQHLNIPSNVNPYAICHSGTGTSAGITFSLWFKGSPSSGKWCRIFDFGDNSVGNSPLNMLLIAKHGNSNQLIFFISWNAYYLTPENYFDDNWHHIVWSISKTNKWRIYIDNVLKHANRETNSNWAIPNANWQRRYIGRSCYSQDGWFVGNIDDFRIYNKVLTTVEICTLYMYDVPSQNNTSLYTLSSSKSDFVVTPQYQTSPYVFSTVLSANKIFNYTLYGNLYLQKGAYVIYGYLSQSSGNEIPCVYEFTILDERNTPRVVSFMRPSNNRVDRYDVYIASKPIIIESGGFYKTMFRSIGLNNKSQMTSEFRIKVSYTVNNNNNVKLSSLLTTFVNATDTQIRAIYNKGLSNFSTLGTANEYINNAIQNRSTENDARNYARFMYYGFNNTSEMQNAFKYIYNTIPSLNDTTNLKNYLQSTDHFGINTAEGAKTNAETQKRVLEKKRDIRKGVDAQTSYRFEDGSTTRIDAAIQNIKDVMKTINELNYKSILGNIEPPSLKQNVNVFSVFDTSQGATINDSKLTIERFAKEQLRNDGLMPDSAERALYIEEFV